MKVTFTKQIAHLFSIAMSFEWQGNHNFCQLQSVCLCITGQIWFQVIFWPRLSWIWPTVYLNHINFGFYSISREESHILFHFLPLILYHFSYLLSLFSLDNASLYSPFCLFFNQLAFIILTSQIKNSTLDSEFKLHVYTNLATNGIWMQIQHYKHSIYHPHSNLYIVNPNSNPKYNLKIQNSSWYLSLDLTQISLSLKTNFYTFFCDK